MKKAIASPELQRKLIPRLVTFSFGLLPCPFQSLDEQYQLICAFSWELGCRRLTPGLPYLNAVQQTNVNVIRDGIKRITEVGIETDNGQVNEVDVIICATGFITSFSSRFNIVGHHGRTLKDMWKHRGAEAYLGTAIAGLPNYYSTCCTASLGHRIPY
jgi:cation diffusion facilitator CzcD-associated flavoprotein CzcO